MLADIFRAGLAAVDPSAAVERWLRSPDGVSLLRSDRIIVIGAGKASGRMAAAAEQLLGDRIVDGLVIMKDGHGVPLRQVRLREAGHPVPDGRGQAATNEMLELLRGANAKTPVLCLVSGGGSALLVAPAFGLTLSDKQAATDQLLRAGADIGELNTVRKHLSRVKGGGISRAACAAPMTTLIVSDVLGDRLDVIASGPTVSDGSTYRDALAVIGKYGLRGSISERVRTHLAKGVSGFIPETMKEGDRCLSNKRAVVIAALPQALDAARSAAERMGYEAQITRAELRGEARDAARTLAEQARAVQKDLKPGAKLCLVSGGETTVTVTGPGTGGRNQELALAFALEISGTRGITLLSAGTDGTDGPTDAAGAIVDGATIPDAGKNGLAAADYLAQNDSYSFFRRYDEITGRRTHVMTGPTGTNVMDMQVVVIDQSA